MNLKKINSRILMILFVFFLSFEASAQLSGNYTIDPTKSASSTNYVTWTSAISDLLNGSRSDGGTVQGPGISSSVVFTVYDTVYTSTYVDLTSITGSTPSNRITFKSSSGDRTKCILTNASTTTNTNDFVINLNGADYITFQDMSFERSGNNTYSTVIQISNDANGNKFNNCLIKGRKIPSSSSLGFNYIYGACVYFGSNADSTEINNCRLLYGYNGIYCATTCSDNLFSGNTLDSNGSSGMYITNQTRLIVRDNTFNMGDFGANLGHYTSYGMRIETSPSMQVYRNKVYMTAVNAQVVRGIIIASTTSTANNPTMIYNNWVVNGGGSGDCTGLAVYNCNYLNFVYNNVLITSSLTNSSAYYHYAQYSNTFIKLINNNFINKGAGYAYNVPGTNTANLDSVDYNNLYSNGSYIANWGGSNYSNLSALVAASNKDSHSISLDPGFINNGNLHVSNIAINKKALRYDWIQYDIDNELRDTSGPDIGADEFFPISNDVGITSVDSPYLFCAGKHIVKVKFQNFGVDTIKSVNIQWQVNSNTQSSYAWTGLVAPGASSNSISIGSYVFNQNTAYNLKIWTNSPNNVADGKTINDTLNTVKYTGMTGTYTINDVNADFESFNSAIAAFTSRGICGPITFNVDEGVYNEQLTLVELPGMGINNPIKFVNSTGDSTKVVITLPSTTATGNNNAAVQLRGADNIHFEGITFERTGTNTYANVIHILNNSDNNSFKNCQMKGLKLTAANVSAQNIWSDLGEDNNNRFENNLVKYGNNCVLYTGYDTAREQGTVFIGNTFDSSYSSLVSVSYNDGIRFENNTFKNQIFATSGNSSLILNNCDSGNIINANYFYDNNSETSINLIECQANSSNPAVISNNFLSKPNGYSIYLNNSSYQSVLFNSIHLYGNQSSNSGVYIALGTASNIDILNNNILNVSGYTLYISNSNQVASSDYNNLYAKSNNFVFSGTSYTNLNDVINATGRETNSVTINPYFKSNSNLHIINPLLKGSGTPSALVTSDIDGDVRSTSAPDIGADEFKLSSVDAGIIDLIEPITGACADVYDLKIVVKNFGSDTLKNVTVNWLAQNQAQTAYSWTGKLATNETDTFVIGSFNFKKTLNPKFKFWTVNPNGIADPLLFNDSLELNKSMRALPVALAGADNSVCKGEVAILGPNPLNGFAYTWYDVNSNVLGNGSKLTVAPTVATEYILEVINTSFGCKNRDTVLVSVIDNPVINAGRDTGICLGQMVTIGEQSQTNFMYSWTSFPGTFSSNQSMPSIAPQFSATYVLRVVDNSTNCLSRDTVKVDIIVPPNAAIFGGTEFCKNAVEKFTTNAGANETYNWTTDGTVRYSNNKDSITIQWGAEGNKFVKLIKSNSGGCSDTAEIAVNVFMNPTADFVTDNVCQGQISTFTNLSSDASSYVWEFGNGESTIFKNYTLFYDTSGVYDVSLVAISDDNCKDTLFKQVEIYPIPATDFSFVRVANREYKFIDETQLESGTITSWTWTMGDGTSYSDSSPTHLFKAAANFDVKLCVTSSGGCTKCFSQFVNVVGIDGNYVNKDIRLYPNPNNGEFTVESNSDIVSIQIYNAMGQLIEEFNPDGSKAKIDISSYSNAVYFVKVFDGNNWTSIKVMKQN
jgi:hypothetical protein